ncbi:glycerol dehydrogenase [Niallia circulans]|uniref:iron-containing alcohol dehydrogenase family protein n=1 Tax=Shouchella clausii TaxID=79880 RepID=UPI000BA635BC|nr:iron-containing alcohol dehydrogenase family protein [Shouchella clausii]MCM3550215.1 iron-containing alcohol dehydrogenase family protein [Shouchella clausii]PAF13452.1 oxidoreductase [Shouchella clausii]SPT81856.1 glycerol dehydrogenase [Niallia circulans]
MESLVVRGAPHEYALEEGILSSLEARLQARGYRHVLVVHGDASWKAAERFWPEFTAVEATYWQYNGICSQNQMDQLATVVRSGKYDAIVGVGGGKLLDLVKGGAYQTKRPYVLVPTLASNCAPWTPLAAVYTDEGTYTHYDVYPENASLLLLEPRLLLTAPKELFVAGIGDTLAKWYEADVQLGSMDEKSPALEVAYYTAKLCRDILLDKSDEALHAFDIGEVSTAFCKVAETIIMLGGMVGGFGDQYGRIAGAHSIHNGLTVLAETHDILHGDKVAYGILVQLALEEKWHEIEALRPFYEKVGLPYSLTQLGISLQADLRSVAEKATVAEESIHVMPFPVSADAVLSAVKKLEEKNEGLQAGM